MHHPIWYRNGNWLKILPSLPGDDAGFLFGAIISDRIRTFRLVPFQLENHVRRFRRSCELAKVPFAHTDRAIRHAISVLIEKNAGPFNGENDVAIVMLATPGPLDGRTPTFILHTMPLDFVAYRHMFQSGARLVIPPIQQLPAHILDPAIKHRSRLHWWIANQHARQTDPLAEALLVNSNGFITETATANIIVVKRGNLLTPPRHSVLPGISLQTVREMCASGGLAIHECDLRPQDCYDADEVLLTCTSWCMAGVSQLDGRSIPWQGPIYQLLAKLWSEKVGLDYIDQILSSNS